MLLKNSWTYPRTPAVTKTKWMFLRSRVKVKTNMPTNDRMYTISVVILWKSNSANMRAPVLWSPSTNTAFILLNISNCFFSHTDQNKLTKTMRKHSNRALIAETESWPKWQVFDCFNLLYLPSWLRDYHSLCQTYETTLISLYMIKSMQPGLSCHEGESYCYSSQ